jgi:hypothetical protein
VTDRFFCSAASSECGEPLYGTVARIRKWLLLEYPSAWRRDAIAESRLLPDEVKHYVRATADRTLLIRREHTRRGALHAFRIDSETGAMVRSTIDDYTDLLANPQPTPVTAPIFAVCTHGRHDKCCAKFGLPVFCAFRDHAGESAWQCSHVGGDRFAANVVVFPYGIYYGRVTPEEAAEVIRSTNAGEVWLERYRGRSIFPRIVQAAEYFERRESNTLTIGAFREFIAETVTPGVTRVRFSNGHCVDVEVSQSAHLQRLTCSAADLSQVPEYRLIRYTQET